MISYTASIEWSVTCARCRVRTILSAFVVGPRDEIPWPSLLDGWNVLGDMVLCPRHTITISDKEES